ncbi:MAG: hypothetical protein AAGG50_03735 [Bacteroidota bacterium]
MSEVVTLDANQAEAKIQEFEARLQGEADTQTQRVTNEGSAQVQAATAQATLAASSAAAALEYRDEAQEDADRAANSAARFFDQSLEGGEPGATFETFPQGSAEPVLGDDYGVVGGLAYGSGGWAGGLDQIAVLMTLRSQLTDATGMRVRCVVYDGEGGTILADVNREVESVSNANYELVTFDLGGVVAPTGANDLYVLLCSNLSEGAGNRFRIAGDDSGEAGERIAFKTVNVYEAADPYAAAAFNPAAIDRKFWFRGVRSPTSTSGIQVPNQALVDGLSTTSLSISEPLVRREDVFGRVVYNNGWPSRPPGFAAVIWTSRTAGVGLPPEFGDDDLAFIPPGDASTGQL